METTAACPEFHQLPAWGIFTLDPLPHVIYVVVCTRQKRALSFTWDSTVVTFVSTAVNAGRASWWKANSRVIWIDMRTKGLSCVKSVAVDSISSPIVLNMKGSIKWHSQARLWLESKHDNILLCDTYIIHRSLQLHGYGLCVHVLKMSWMCTYEHEYMSS